MKKTIKFLMLAFMAMLASVSFSSCRSDDDEPEQKKYSYHLRLENLDTNCKDGDKYTIEIPVPQVMVDANKLDVDFIQASSDDEAVKLFNQFMNTFKTSCGDFYKKAGSLKEGDYVTYKFILYNTSHAHDDLAVSTFTVTKDGIK